jgi:hypothetical protein
MRTDKHLIYIVLIAIALAVTGTIFIVSSATNTHERLQDAMASRGITADFSVQDTPHWIKFYFQDNATVRMFTPIATVKPVRLLEDRGRPIVCTRIGDTLLIDVSSSASIGVLLTADFLATAAAKRLFGRIDPTQWPVPGEQGRRGGYSKPPSYLSQERDSQYLRQMGGVFQDGITSMSSSVSLLEDVASVIRLIIERRGDVADIV